MLNKCKAAAKKSYGESMLEWKERGAAPRPYDAWIQPAYWPGLVDHWCSDAFASRSQRNAENRASAEGAGASTGSVNMLVHKQRFEQTQGREPRWSDELFQPTHTRKLTGEYINVKAKNAQLKYEKAMTEKYGADRGTWPAYDADLWYSTGVDDQNSHGDNYGLGALGKSRGMYRPGGSSSARSHSSQSYSSMPPSTNLTEEDVERISSRLLAKMEAQIEAQVDARLEARFRASSGGSGSQPASMPAQDDEDDDSDDDEGHWSDVGGDGTA
ncbi:uncharacterized protein LOC144560813 [Carex rostrata]